jgi:hypothetical protein
MSILAEYKARVARAYVGPGTITSVDNMYSYLVGPADIFALRSINT